MSDSYKRTNPEYLHTKKVPSAKQYNKIAIDSTDFDKCSSAQPIGLVKEPAFIAEYNKTASVPIHFNTAILHTDPPTWHDASQAISITISVPFTCKCSKNITWVTEHKVTDPCPFCGRRYTGTYNTHTYDIDIEEVHVAIPTKPALRVIFKWVFRHSPTEKMFRICRLLYDWTTPTGDLLYSAKASIAFTNKWFSYSKSELFGIKVCFLGIRFHHKKAYGGYLD